MFGTLAIVAAIAVAFWYYFVRPLSYWSRLGVKQSKPWPFFGDSWVNLLRLMNFYDFEAKVYNMHPEERYSGIYQFSRPILIIRDPELIKQITVKDFEYFTDHLPFVNADADALWSNALNSLHGDRWKQTRNMLSPTFTSSKVRSIYLLMLETAENFVEHFLKKEDGVIEIEMKEAYSRFSNDIIATIAFGVQVNSLKDKKNMFYKMGKALTTFSGFWGTIRFFGHQTFPKLFKKLGIPFLDKQASKYFYSVMDDTLKAREEQNIVRPDLVNIMLEAGKDKNIEANANNISGKSKTAIKLSNQEMTSQAMIFLFGGFDTVSTAMCFGSYELAINKDIQDRLREEINETQQDGKVTHDDLVGMKYMDMVVSEVLRKWTPFAFTDRVCTKPYTIEPAKKNEKPLHLPVNQEIRLSIYGLHRDPKYFPNPEKFDPERFSDGNKRNIVPYTYIPFGAGPRNCIANRFALVEIKALLFNLLLNYEIVPTKKTLIPLVLSKDFLQIPEGGFWLGLKRIKSY